MELLFDTIFHALFYSPVPRIVVKADAPHFTIVINNDAHKVATNLVGRDITGKSVWEVFNPEDAGGNGGELLMDALIAAQKGNQTILMPHFRYDMPSSDQRTLEVKWWQLEIIPLGGNNGKPDYLMATTHNITEQVIKQQAIEEAQTKEKQLNAELAAINEELLASQEELSDLNETLEEQVLLRTRELAISEAKFRNLVEQSPVAIALLKGKDHVVDAVNPEMLKLWDKSEKIIGKPVIEALPEMAGQPYPQILHQVFTSGAPYYGNEAEVVLIRNHVPHKGYYNFINYPLSDAAGNIESIIVVAIEVTHQVLARRKIEENQNNLHTLIMTARYPLMILRGREWVVEIANQGIASLWSKSLTDITGRKLLDILPELENQPFPALLQKVFETGTSYGQEEEVFYLNTPDGILAKYISFYYDPILDGAHVSGIIVTAQDISDFVNARKELERVYEQARLSKEAAQLGLFDLDLIKGTMEWDVRCRELFGISHQYEVNYENDFLPGLHEDDRERINTIIAGLYDRRISNGNYDVEYRTVGAQDGRVRWVRAKGKVFFNDKDEPIRFIGSVLDISDKKKEEQRKNDFIGMVSHELKTPLTSLKANIQMLHLKSKKLNDEFTTSALTQAEKQITKMTGMISGFLNLSRLESGSLHLNIAEFDLNLLIQEVINDIQLTGLSHIINFTSSGVLNVHGDEDKINHVISNLIANAIKYSEQGTTIQVVTQVNEFNAIVFVKDEGIGIEDTDLEKLFSRYYRVERMNTRYISGFGIGLYLCSEIIQLHKGNIWVESEVGKGSTFTFTLPLNKKL